MCHAAAGMLGWCKPNRLGNILKNVLSIYVFHTYQKKKKIYLIEYQDNPGASTWLNLKRALQFVLISLYTRESAKPDC